MPCSWENPMELASLQPSVRVAKGKYPFQPRLMVAKDGCKEAYFIGFFQSIYENELISENIN